MYTRAKSGKDNSVIYYDNKENMIIRTGGSRAWRNNNPGNIRPGGFSSKYGAIGSAGGFAIFPTYQAGRQALAALLKGKTYSGLTLFSAIARYAPSHENNTENYRKLIKKLTGLDLDKKIGNLTDAEFNSVLEAIQIIEGFTKGKEQFIERSRIIDADHNKKGSLEKFKLENGKWLTRSEIIPMLLADKIINAVYVRKNKKSYVRSKPDKTDVNNFSKMTET
ncbi:MAG: DUF3892 domain-containing protein [Elusimicrobiota bacterium]